MSLECSSHGGYGALAASKVPAYRRQQVTGPFLADESPMEHEQDVERSSSKTRRTSGGRQPLRVLLVEDNEDIVEMLTAECQEIDHVTVVGRAATANEAIESFLAIEPDVVLIDVQLRTGSGIDVIRGIRLLGERPRPVLLAMSNALSETVRPACLSAGADEFFDKSLEYEKLLVRLAELAR